MFRLLGAARSLSAAVHTARHSPSSICNQRHLFGGEPKLPARPCTRLCEGSEWQDEYSWTEAHVAGPGVSKALLEERRYAEGWLQRSAQLAKSLHDETLESLPSSQVSIPERVGDHEYFVRQLPGSPHPCYMRRLAAGTAGNHSPIASPAEVVLDVNELAATHGDYMQVGQLKLSRCGRHVAFTLDTGEGQESFAAFTRSVQTGVTRRLSALGTVVSLEWAASGHTLLCTQPNQLGRPWRVVSYNVAGAGGDGGALTCIYQEADERFFVELGRTKDWAFLTLNCNSKSSSEVRLLPADLAAAPAAAPRLVQERSPGLEYFVEHAGGQLYILSNARGAANYAVFRVPAAAADLGQQHWQPVVAEPAGGGAIEDMDLLSSHLVVYLRRGGRQQVASLPLDPRGMPAVASAANARAGTAGTATRGGAAAGIPAESLTLAPLPLWALSVAAGANAEFRADRLRLLLSSPVHPEAAFDWDLVNQRLLPRPQPDAQQQRLQQQAPRQHQARKATRGAKEGPDAALAAQRPLPDDFGLDVESAAGEFCWRQDWVTSSDGTAVPLTVVHTTGLALPPAVPRPCLLVVYGAYGHCLPTDYLPERIPLLRRGWVLALAHVRGGGELGRRWHAAGRGAAKAASVEDLSACLDHVVDAGYTTPGLVALEAHSAGGLTAGALLNRRPHDVGAALLEAPFVDVLSVMCQPELPLTVHEYDEWGDPRFPDQLQQLQAICPYHNVRPASFPPMLLTCSQQDARVPFWVAMATYQRKKGRQAAETQASSCAQENAVPDPILQFLKPHTGSRVALGGKLGAGPKPACSSPEVDAISDSSGNDVAVPAVKGSHQQQEQPHGMPPAAKLPPLTKLNQNVGHPGPVSCADICTFFASDCIEDSDSDGALAAPANAATTTVAVPQPRLLPPPPGRDKPQHIKRRRHVVESEGSDDESGAVAGCSDTAPGKTTGKLGGDTAAEHAAQEKPEPESASASDWSVEWSDSESEESDDSPPRAAARRANSTRSKPAAKPAAAPKASAVSATAHTAASPSELAAPTKPSATVAVAGPLLTHCKQAGVRKPSRKGVAAAQLPLTVPAGTIGRLDLQHRGGEEQLQLDLMGILYDTELVPLAATAALVRTKASGDELIVEQLFPALLRCQPQQDFLDENAELFRQLEAYDSDRHCADVEPRDGDGPKARRAAAKRKVKGGVVHKRAAPRRTKEPPARRAAKAKANPAGARSAATRPRCG
ncbi:hypothetical protein D9Q98_001046 [Chlorella vulgaris]|uniref:Prolyl endopeptidase-like n=1 Tax=Chlorella vulgaris TaxID=3077 RepID=A0A9D4Z284_CHLVU|nr:hypothetical protein D9Q98_001046 [Chlorella vulgaris]